MTVSTAHDLPSVEPLLSHRTSNYGYRLIVGGEGFDVQTIPAPFREVIRRALMKTET